MEQDSRFGVSIIYFAMHHCGNKYIYYKDLVIQMKLDKALMFVNIW